MNSYAELIGWLGDAYAMDKTMETNLKKLTVHPHTHLALRAQAAVHSVATQQHAEEISTCLKKLGSDTSMMKTALAQGMNFMRSAGTTFAKDERIKDVLTVLVTEHFNISCHTILRTGAARLGQVEIVNICDKILVDEKCLVEWLQAHLPQIMAAYSEPWENEYEPGLKAGHANDLTLTSQSKRRAQWEFGQLAQNMSLFGGRISRSMTYANG